MARESAPRAKPSATVMILRDGGEGVEVLLGERRGGPAFGRAHVFPGGLVSAADAGVAMSRARGVSESAARRRLGVDNGALAYWVAAIREVFEETGLLFLSGPAPPAPQLDEWRQQLASGAIGFGGLCAAQRLELDVGSLHYVAHWITPQARTARFDTRFFLAAVPVGQRARADGTELLSSVWSTPRAALEAHQAGELKLAPPTAVELQRLSRFAAVAGALTWAAQRWRRGVPAILPVVEGSGATERLRLPAAADIDAREPDE